MRRFPALVLTALACTAGPLQAADTCLGGPRIQWRSAQEARKAAADLGYSRIAKVIIEDGCYEVVTFDAQDRIVGVQLDPVTLALVKLEDPR